MLLLYISPAVHPHVAQYTLMQDGQQQASGCFEMLMKASVGKMTNNNVAGT